MSDPQFSELRKRVSELLEVTNLVRGVMMQTVLLFPAFEILEKASDKLARGAANLSESSTPEEGMEVIQDLAKVTGMTQMATEFLRVYVNRG